MEFVKTKLPITAALKLSSVSIASVKPFALVHVPHYVLLRRNEKFVCVKRPLDFFTPQELDQLKGYSEFYVPKFVDSVLPFVDAAKRIKAILTWNSENNSSSNEDSVQGPLSYELSDAVTIILGPLWGPGAMLEPFLISVLVNELCDTLPGDLLLSVRDRSVDDLESALLCSAWTVFLALHLGYTDIPFLNKLRRESLEWMGTESSPLSLATKHEYSELMKLARRSFDSRLSEKELLAGEYFSRTDVSTRVSHKVSAKLERVKRDFIEKGNVIPTLVGTRGFVDV